MAAASLVPLFLQRRDARGDSPPRKPAGRKRVLIVSPHFPPINAADHHRVRMALPYFEENGWSAEILAVRPEDVEGVLDPELEATHPPGLPVHRTRALPMRWTRRVGLGSLALRAYKTLRKRGDDLLATGRFDLVFFSTTQFGVLPLGPHWKRCYGVPYVLDFQDEWVSCYYAEHPQTVPPGGRFKYEISRILAQRQEPEVVRGAAAIVSVSRRYNDRLRRRYPELRPDMFHELPFGAAAHDFTALELNKAKPPFLDSADERRHWVYVGRGGPDLRCAAAALFRAVRRALDEGILEEDSVRLHFIGTSYAPGKSARESFAPLARNHGLEDLVSEQTARVPYFTALRCLVEASAVLILGSDDASYTASKIYPALLARRPLLAVLHEESPALGVLREVGVGPEITFKSAEDEGALTNRIFQKWILSGAFDRKPALDEEALERHSAAAMTRRLLGIFNTVQAGKAATR